MSYHRGSGIPDETFCQTDSPPQTVRMSTDGSFKTCSGETCLGNAGEGTPTLAYGLTAGVGPFNCRSETSGITCTVTGPRLHHLPGRDHARGVTSDRFHPSVT
jgi:hypothetical protein